MQCNGDKKINCDEQGYTLDLIATRNFYFYFYFYFFIERSRGRERSKVRILRHCSFFLSYFFIYIIIVKLNKIN